jgi:tetraacyldisaccharide 4'-kinase
MITAPAFWFRPPAAPGLAARALAPLGALYGAATARRLRLGAGKGLALDGVRVICVGNLNVGGTGKTPTVIALIEALRARGHAPVVLGRGHGGRLSGPVQVDPARHDAAQVGDEALLLAAFAPVWVARRRADGLRAAAAAGARVLVMDDGFQDPALRVDLAIVVVDAARGFGNGLCLPAGPLREPVPAGLARADLVVSIGDAGAQAAFAARWGATIAALAHPPPRLQAEVAPLPMGMDWRGMRVLAFAGIGHPDKLFATLRALGADVVGGVGLADHQPLGAALMARLARQAAGAGAQLVTTEKDAVRLPPALRMQVLTLPVRLRWQAPERPATAAAGTAAATADEGPADRAQTAAPVQADSELPGVAGWLPNGWPGGLPPALDRALAQIGL